MDEIKKRVHEIVTRNFSITKCPESVYEDFVSYARKETNDNYSMAIKMLLEGMKGNIKEVLLYEQYMELKTRLAEEIEELNNRINELEKKTELKTFGKK